MFMYKDATFRLGQYAGSRILAVLRKCSDSVNKRSVLTTSRKRNSNGVYTAVCSDSMNKMKCSDSTKERKRGDVTVSTK